MQLEQMETVWSQPALPERLVARLYAFPPLMLFEVYLALLAEVGYGRRTVEPVLPARQLLLPNGCWEYGKMLPSRLRMAIDDSVGGCDGLAIEEVYASSLMRDMASVICVLSSS